MRSEKNIRVTLASRPVGFPKVSDFNVEQVPISEPGEGEILIKASWLSLDPYMRARLDEAKGYAEPIQIGEVIIGAIVGEVLETRTPRFKIGDIIEGRLGWQSYAVSDGTDMQGSDLRKIDPSLGPIQTSVGVLGMPAFTAYFGFLDVCEPVAGDTVVVSAASGAVGQIVGQIAKIMGCHVVGTAGSDKKIDYVVDELGFDSGINYKTENLDQALLEHCPKGIDVYFDNVGGVLTDAVFKQLNIGARVAICGQISQYNLEKPELTPRNLWQLIVSQAKVQGFLQGQFLNRHPEALLRVSNWIKEGKVKYKEDVTVGLENSPAAFIGMLNGENFGKTLVKISD